MKRFGKWKILISALLVCLVCVGGTLAYLKATDGSVTNTFSLANGGSRIDEGDGGDEASKIVGVTNTGTANAYIRASVVVSAGVSRVEFVSARPDVKADDTIYVVLGSDWTKSGDYYYFNGIVAPGDTTTPLVNGVFCGKDIDADSFQVIVYGESTLAGSSYSLDAAIAAFNTVS